MSLERPRHVFGNAEPNATETRQSRFDDAAHVIADAVAEAQAALYDHYQCGQRTSAEVLAKINVIMYDPKLIQAMHNHGYIPANSPPEVNFTLPAGLE